MAHSRKPWTLALAGTTLAGMLGVAFFTPLSALLPACQLHLTTGLHCPGCGATRCLRAIAAGDLATALTSNLLLLAALAIGLGVLLFMSLREWTGRPRALPAFPRNGGWWIAGLVLLFGILRNLPLWPFTSLAPH